MNKRMWMSLAILACMAVAAPAQQWQKSTSYAKPQPLPQSFVRPNASYAASAKMSQLTVELLTHEALVVSQKLWQAGQTAEARFLLHKVLSINPNDPRVRAALKNIGQTPSAVALREVEHFIRKCKEESARARTKTVKAGQGSAGNCCSAGSCPVKSVPQSTRATNSGRVQGGIAAFVTNAAAKCKCGSNCKCKENCPCGAKCPCKGSRTLSIIWDGPVSVKTRRSKQMQTISVPHAIVRRCPVLSGRVRYAECASQPVVVPHRSFVSPTTCFVVVPVQQSQAVTRYQVIRQWAPAPQPVVAVKSVRYQAPAYVWRQVTPPCPPTAAVCQAVRPTCAVRATGRQPQTVRVISFVVTQTADGHTVQPVFHNLNTANFSPAQSTQTQPLTTSR